MGQRETNRAPLWMGVFVQIPDISALAKTLLQFLSALL
jgi:hypothetical protein